MSEFSRNHDAFVGHIVPAIGAMLEEGTLGETQLLMWGMPYEHLYLEALGVSIEAVIAYDPSVLYCADVVLLPVAQPDPADLSRRLLQAQVIARGDRESCWAESPFLGADHCVLRERRCTIGMKHEDRTMHTDRLPGRESHSPDVAPALGGAADSEPSSICTCERRRRCSRPRLQCYRRAAVMTGRL